MFDLLHQPVIFGRTGLTRFQVEALQALQGNRLREHRKCTIMCLAIPFTLQASPFRVEHVQRSLLVGKSINTRFQLRLRSSERGFERLDPRLHERISLKPFQPRVLLMCKCHKLVRVLAQSHGNLVQQLKVRTRNIKTHEACNPAVKKVHEVRSLVVDRAKLPSPEIHEERIAVIRLPLQVAIAVALLGLRISSIRSFHRTLDLGLLRLPGTVRTHLPFDAGLQRHYWCFGSSDGVCLCTLVVLRGNDNALRPTAANNDLVKLRLVTAHQLKRAPLGCVQLFHHLIPLKDIEPYKRKRSEPIRQLLA